MGASPGQRDEVPPFARSAFRSGASVSRIGEGDLGGKAGGLLLVRDRLLARIDAARFPGIETGIPRMVVIATGVFDAFLDRNRLRGIAAAGLPDDRIAQAFLLADLPAEVLGDLRALVEEMRTPLAVRSSSRLEDSLGRPFAGVYATKMVPNNQPEADFRFLRLVEAIKLVYASTFFRDALLYARAGGLDAAAEKMAVIVQEVVGERRHDRFYPDVSGVARSYNFFPAAGASPREGVVNLALGLGKTIVDGGMSWMFSPARPAAPAPFASPEAMLERTQRRFWAINMGRPPAYDPMAETEYLVEEDLAAADYDGTLARVASTYDAERDRIVPGTAAAGPRVVDFAPLLVHGSLPLAPLVRRLLHVAEEVLGAAVELELAMVLPRPSGAAARCGLLQLRPMLLSEEEVAVDDAAMRGQGVLVASDRVMGNGAIDEIEDVVYVKRSGFEPRFTRSIAVEIEERNRALVDAGRPYLLIGFGRWGSSDPSLGVPLDWAQIGGARAIVESTWPGMDVEPSQGAHFFHNIVSFRVPYLCVRHEEDGGRGRTVDWEWLDRQEAVAESAHVRHVRLARKLLVKVDGRTGRGVIQR